MASQDLCTLLDVRQALELPSSDTSRDPLIQALITAASDAIMDATERQFAPKDDGPTTHRFKFDSQQIDLAPYDLRSVSTFTVHPETSSPITLTTTDYQLLPITTSTGTYQNVRLSGWRPDLLISDTSLRFGYALCDITGAWGFPTPLPTNVVRATAETVISWLRRDVSQFDLGDLNDGAGRLLLPSDQFPIPTRAWLFLGSFRRLSAQMPVL